MLMLLATEVLANPDSKIERISKAYGSSKGSADWDPSIDLNKDGIINIFDLALASKSKSKITSSYSTLQGDTTTISVEPIETIIEIPGKDFSIDINITDAPSTYGFEFKLSWNPSILSVTDITYGTFLTQRGAVSCAQDNHSVEGWIMFGCTLLEPTIPQTYNNGNLAIVNFTVLGEGETNLHLYDTYLLDDILNNYAHESKDGNFIADFAAPIVTILSPANTTYFISGLSIPLTFLVNEPATWMGYSFDGQANVTIDDNTTLTNLSEGSHNVIVYAKDRIGKEGYDLKYFTVFRQPIVVGGGGGGHCYLM